MKMVITHQCIHYKEYFAHTFYINTSKVLRCYVNESPPRARTDDTVVSRAQDCSLLA